MRTILIRLMIGSLMAIPTAPFAPLLTHAADAVDDSEVEPAVTPNDLQIVGRARAILNSPAVWNQADTRVCPPDAVTFSLYCAIEKATLEIDGKFAHRGSAMQQTRFVVDEITAKRDYQHRLKDYNNDPTTSFSDIQHVFDMARARIAKKLKAR